MMRPYFMAGGLSLALSLSGCLSLNAWDENLRDFDVPHDKAQISNSTKTRMPIFIPLASTGTNVTAYIEDNGFVLLGDSLFEKEFTPVFDAIQVAKRLGATHILFGRAHTRKIEYDEQRVGSTLATSYTSGSVASTSSTRGTAYSPKSGYSSFNATTYGNNTYNEATYTSIPYTYTVHIEEDLYNHLAIFLLKKATK